MVFLNLISVEYALIAPPFIFLDLFCHLYDWNISNVLGIICREIQKEQEGLMIGLLEGSATEEIKNLEEKYRNMVFDRKRSLIDPS